MGIEIYTVHGGAAELEIIPFGFSQNRKNIWLEQ